MGRPDMSNRPISRTLALYVGAYVVFLYLPMTLIPIFSFNDSVQAAFPLKGFTLAWYETLAANERLHAAVGNSVIVATVAAAVATACGTLIAYADTRRRGRFAPMIAGLARLPLLIPGVIIGIALLILVNLIDLGPSLAAIILGHIAICLPISVTVMRTRFRAVPRSLEEAANWGNTSILYRTDLIKNPEKSWNLLWNPEYSRRLATIDAVHDTPVVAALLAGVSPFDMTDAEMVKVEEKLRAQRPLLRSYTTDMTSVEQSLASGELVAAMTWNASATALKKQGVPVEFMKPKEGMLTWVCGFVLLKDSKHVDLAYDFINSRLESGSGKHLIESYGYGSASSAAFAAVDKAKLDELSLPSDPEVVLKETVFTGPMKQNDALAKMFEKVKAGG